MKEITGDLWDYYSKHPICITINGYVKKNGEAVMGRGCAYEATQRIQGIAHALGEYIIENGLGVYLVGVVEPLSLIIHQIIVFPVKYHRRQKANRFLIEKSAEQLKTLVDLNKWPIVILPRSGCGYGRLKWKDVKLILEKYLDDRFWMISRK